MNKKIIFIILLLISSIFFIALSTSAEAQTCDINITWSSNSTYTIDQNNTHYCLNQSWYIAGVTAIEFANPTQNSTLDCLNYNLDGNDTFDTYGVYLTGSSTKNSTIKNCNITNFYYGINLYAWANNINIINNTGSSNYIGILLSNSNSNNITNNTFYDNNMGIYLFSFGGGPFSENNTIKNNIVFDNNDGIILFDPNTKNNNITGGSIHDNSDYDYDLRNPASTNFFRDTNFTGVRKIFFSSSRSWFNYNNVSSNGIWLKTNVSAKTNITRKLISWTQSLMQWNDTNSSGTGITVRYNITGLKNDIYYNIYNNSILTYSLQTDSSGNLPSFTIYLSSEHEIKVEEYTEPPKYFDNSTNSTLAGTPIEFRLRWTDNIGLSGYVFAIDNGTNPHWYSDNSFPYRKNISIDNSAGSVLTDYPIYMTIFYTNRMQSDFDDLRFTYYNSTTQTETELKYWIHRKVDSSYIELSVKVPYIQASGYETLYMYYGNSIVSTPGYSSNDVFGFWDGVNRTSIITNAFSYGTTYYWYVYLAGSPSKIYWSMFQSGYCCYPDVWIEGTQVWDEDCALPCQCQNVHDVTSYYSSGTLDIGNYHYNTGGPFSMSWYVEGTDVTGADVNNDAGLALMQYLPANITVGVNENFTIQVNLTNPTAQSAFLNYYAAMGVDSDPFTGDHSGNTSYCNEADFDLTLNAGDKVSKNITCNITTAGTTYLRPGGAGVVKINVISTKPSYSIGKEEYMFEADDWTTFPTGGIEDWSNVTKVVNFTAGTTIRWRVYANDTSNNWNVSEIYTFITTTALSTMNLSLYRVWWNDSVTAYGRALDKQGNPLANKNVNLTVSDTRCNNISDSNGYWQCRFNAPLELGTYTVNVRIETVFINTTSLTVKIKYGETPIGTIDRLVYEEPMMIQEPSGKIRRVWSRIMVWRG